MDIKITLRKDKKNRKNEYPVVIQLSNKKELARISLAISVGLEDFDEKNQKIKRTNKQSSTLNENIEYAKKLIQLSEHHLKDILLNARLNIKANSEIAMFKKLYEKIKLGLESDDNYGVELPNRTTDIDIIKDAVVYEFSQNKRQRPVIPVSAFFRIQQTAAPVTNIK